MHKVTKKKFWLLMTLISVVGMVLRFSGFPFEGIDYEQCLSAWSQQLKEIGNIRALSAYSGDYNYPYITILYFLTFLPVSSLYSIKMVSVIFDYMVAGILSATAMHAVTDQNHYGVGAIVYALVLCNPLVVINSGYLAQCEAVWTALALLSFYLIIVKEKPGWGMFAFGMAIAMKLQSIFILPILMVFYFYKKKFSILHILWVPVAIEVLCLPAIIGGCGWNSAIMQYIHQLGEYPSLFYYYPNIWTWFQEAPYDIFGTMAMAFAFITLLLFAVLFIKSGKKYILQDYVQYAAWTAMTCCMLLPCMHERYNYMAEVLLPVSAVFDKKLRIPAVALILISTQCIGQTFLGWTPVSYYALSAGNIIIYFYFSAHCLGDLYKEYCGKEMEVC